jgi:hypothetical protein
MSNLITREYNGNVFHFREDGYFNMTKAAKAFGKDVREFFKLQSTDEYLEALADLVGGNPLINVQKGNGISPQVGTWGHPKLAVFYARWLDVKFAVFCDMVIDDILNKKAELTITKPSRTSRSASSRPLPRHPSASPSSTSRP